MSDPSTLTSRPETLDRDFVEPFIERWLAAWNDHDAAAAAALCTEDVVWSDQPLREPARGRDRVRAFAQSQFDAFPDFTLELLEPPLLSTVQPLMLSRLRISGTMLGDLPEAGLAATGARFEFVTIDQCLFRGELVCRFDTYFDTLDVARQMGTLPPVGSRAERGFAALQRLQARFQRRSAQRTRR